MEKTLELDTTKSEDVEKAISKSGGLGARHWQCLLLFLGVSIAYTNRLCMSVAIVAIQQELSENTASKDETLDYGKVLSSFFWGYTVMQVPSGYLARTWSAKQVLSWGIFMSGMTSVIVPWVQDGAGWKVLCACRVVTGLSQACLLPCVHTLLSKWVPPTERGRLGSFTYAGAQFGTVLSYPISGALVDAAGWRSVFYFFGGASILWAIGFLFLGSDSPTMSSRRPFCGISHPEREHIESSLGVLQQVKGEPKKIVRTPWLEILTSAPFWALVTVHCCQNWGFWMLLTEMPTYMFYVLDFNFAENGWKSALPYLAMLLLTMPVSWLSDWSQKKGLSRDIARKVSNTVGHWGPALALLGLCFVPIGDTTLPVVILIIAVGSNVGTLCGFQINHIDLSPNFAGLLMSISNCVASVVAILAPLIVDVIVTDKADANQWHIVFYISAAIYFLGNLIFILFGSAETQVWNEPSAPSKNVGVVFSREIATVSTTAT